MRALSFFGAFALLVATNTASAQTDPVKVQALKRYQEAIAFHEKGQEEEAYLQLTQAYAVMQTPPILFDLARTEQLTGRLLASAQHFRAYVAVPDHPKITKELREKARAFLAEVDAKIGHVVIDAPADSILSVDGKDVTGTEVDVTPGPHTISARFGEQHGYVTLTAPAGVRTPAHVTFDVAQTGPPVPVVAPPPPQTEPPTQHGATSRGVSTTGTVVRWGLSGLAVVGIGMGIGFGVDSQSKASDASSFQTSHRGPCAVSGSSTCSQYMQLQSDANQSSTIAWVSYGVGAAAAVGALAAWLFWPKESPASVSVIPSIGPGRAGLQFGASF